MSTDAAATEKSMPQMDSAFGDLRERCRNFEMPAPKRPQSGKGIEEKYTSTERHMHNSAPAEVRSCWGGRTSDKYLAVNSDFLDIIEPSDKVLAHRGFPIADDLTICHAELLIPTERRANAQFTKDGVTKTNQIANRRIHIEQAIRRKCFRILKFRYQKYKIPLDNFPQYKRILLMTNQVGECIAEIADVLKGINHCATLESYDNKYDEGEISIIVEEENVLKTFTKANYRREQFQDVDVNECITILQIRAEADITNSMKKELNKRKLSAENVIFFIDEASGVIEHTSPEFVIARNGKGTRKAVTEYLEKKIHTELEEMESLLQKAKNEIQDGLTKSTKSEDQMNILKDAMKKTTVALSKCETIRKSMIPTIGRTMDTTKSKYLEKLYTELDKLDEEGLIGYGHIMGKLIIDVDEEKVSSKPHIDAKIKEIFNGCPEKPEINYQAKRLKSYINPGDKLFVHHEPPESYGTIGAFAKDNETTTGFTCWHVIKDNETPSVSIDGDRKEIGKVVYTSKTIDFAALDIADDLVKSQVINTEIQHSGNKTLKPMLFDDRTVDLTSSEVYKVGASSNHTKGVVVSSDYKHVLPPVKAADNILVKGCEETQHFAKEGDSGSIIYRLDPEDVDDETAQLISMFQGELFCRGEKHEPLSFSFRIDKPVKDTNKELNRELKFD